AATRVPTLDDLLAGMPGPESADINFDMESSSFELPVVEVPVPTHVEGPKVIDIPTPPPFAMPPPIVVAPPSIEPPDVTPTLTPGAPGPPMDVVPTVIERAEPTPARSIIADAFSALLAAEQGEPGAAPPRFAGNGSPSPVVTDTMIEDVARRVIQRLALGSSEQMQ